MKEETFYSSLSPVKDHQTLNKWYAHWIENYKKGSVKIGTYQNYQQYYSCIIKKELGCFPIEDICPEQIQNLYNDLIRSGYSVSTVKIVSSILGGCLEQAVRNGLLPQNPVRLAVLPREPFRKEHHCLSRSEQTLFSNMPPTVICIRFICFCFVPDCAAEKPVRSGLATLILKRGFCISQKL